MLYPWLPRCHFKLIHKTLTFSYCHDDCFIICYLFSWQNTSRCGRDHISEFTPLASLKSSRYRSNECKNSPARRSSSNSTKTMFTHWRNHDYSILPSLFGYSNKRCNSSMGYYYRGSGLETSL